MNVTIMTWNQKTASDGQMTMNVMVPGQKCSCSSRVKERAMGKKWEKGSTKGTVFAFPGHTRGKGDPRKIKTKHKALWTYVNDSHGDHQAAAQAAAVVA